MTKYRAYGKQIKRGSEHVADAADETYAQIIADSLNGLRPYQRDALTVMGIATGDADPLAHLPTDRRYFPIVIDPKMPLDTIRMQGADYATRPDQTVWSRTDGHTWQRQQDEYACSCGARWDVVDGEDHP